MSIEALGSSGVPAPATPKPPLLCPAQLPEELPLHQVEARRPSFPHSPPDSSNAVKSDPSDSELSDLDDDLPIPEGFMPPPANEPHDIGEVVPDHWSGTVPVFKPTMGQFENFKLFVRHLFLGLQI